MKGILKNKTAILLTDGLKILLAVLVISMLVYLAVHAFGIVKKQSLKEQAKVNLNKIVFAINQVVDGKREKANLLIEGPNDWYVLPFPLVYREYPNIVNSEVPEKCNEKCLCICEKNKKEDCDLTGVCSEVRMQVELKNANNAPEASFTIDGQEIEISKDNDMIFIRRKQ